ncbi:MAG: lipopolysaccharide biosynthesis protein [Lachnospiraceae bacterium]|nr:lipopolysaccharide biosynthesis protein [Lachnospiraceae bacterium]
MDVKKFLKNILKYTVPSVISAIVGIVVIPIISRVFPTEDYGKINLFYSVGNMLMYIVLMGLDSALIRFYFEPPEEANKNKIFELALWTSVSISIILSLISVLFFSKQISNYLFGELQINMLIALLLYIIGLILFRLVSIEMRMENKAFLYNIQQILLIITNRVSFVLIAFYSTEYKYSIWVITICSLFFGLIFLLLQKNLKDLGIPKLKTRVLKKIFSFSIPLMPTMVMVWANNSVAKIVLSGFNDYESVGILSIATSVANIFSLIPAAFATYWSPFMYKNYKSEKEFIQKVHNYICMLSLIIVLGIFCTQDILYTIVGGDYKVSQPYFMLVMLTPIQTLICETTSYGIVLSNKTKFNLLISVVSLLVNYFVGYYSYNYLGVYGVVMGIAISAIIQLYLKTIIGQKYYRSINNKYKTIGCFSLIISSCVLNVLFYENIMIRILYTLGIFVLLFVIYNKEILSCKKILANYKGKNKN